MGDNGNTPDDKGLGARALSALEELFGTPEVLESRQWKQYRWSLRRPQCTSLSCYLTLAPEHSPARPNVLIGDPGRPPGESVCTLTLECAQCVEALVAELRERMQCP